MTREEAIKILVRAQRGLIATALSEYEHKMIEALEMALSALRGPTREQAEKMRGSMTNREAALKSCKDRLEHLENAPSHHCGKRQRQRAIELEKVKIEALLHQIWEEKLWHDAKTDPPKTPGLYYGKKDDTNSMYPCLYRDGIWVLDAYPQTKMDIVKWADYTAFVKEDD